MRTVATLNNDIIRKLIWGAGALAVCSTVLDVASLLGIQRLCDEVQQQGNVTARQLAVAGDIKAAVLTVRMANRGVMLFSSIHNDAAVEKAEKAFQTGHADLEAKLAAFEGRAPSEQSGRLAADVRQALAAYTGEHETVAGLCRKGQVADAVTYDSAVGVQLGGNLSKAAEEIGKEQMAATEGALARADGTRRWSWTTTAAMSVVCTLLNGILIYLALRMARRLRVVSASLERASTEMTETARQVSSISGALTASATGQASSLEQISASTEALANTAARGAETAGQALSAVEEESRIEAELQSSMQSMSQSIGEINGSSQQISRVIKVIDEIAFQTNILALNAAVEAARAGEAGMGFAVVADEVRTLAQRSAQSAHETAEMIENSIQSARTGAERMQAVAGCLERRSKLHASVREHAQAARTASEEEAAGIHELRSAAREIRRATEQTARTAAEGTGVSERLTQETERLGSASGTLEELVGRRG